MAQAPFLTLQSIGLSFGHETLLKGTDMFVNEGDRIALVGRNGSGKSTLLKIAAGFIEADKGDRMVMPRARIEYLPQEPDLSGFATVLDYCLDGITDADDHHEPLLRLLTLGLDGSENSTTLSGGEIRRAALARVLARKPEVLLLDEPTNHLDLATIEWLTDEINALPSACVIISHDRRFLGDVSRKTLWLDRGVTRLLTKGFSHFESWRDDVLEQEEKEAHKLTRKIVEEEHWVRYGVTARRKRNMRRMRELTELRETHRARRQATGSVAMDIAEADLSGKMVAHVESISKRFDSKTIVSNFSMRIMRGDRVAIVGANGSGKTTLIKMITGEMAADQGKITLGRKLEMASLEQKRTSLNPRTTLADALTGGKRDVVVINGRERHVFSYMKDFLFTPSQAKTPLSVLSGGERARVMLARALTLPSNFLVLDEPTNDLDLETLDLLQEMINDYPGTVLLVSHDRDFIDRTASSVIAPSGNGVWIEYAGGYRDMEIQRTASANNGSKKKKPNHKPANRASAKNNTQQSADENRLAEPAKAVKLTFKQSYALKSIPERLEKLDEELAVLAKALADPNFYDSDPERFAKASQVYADKQVEKSSLEEEWLELEMLSESLDSD